MPCNITSPTFDDGVSLVLWYRDDIATPIYTVDARQSTSLENAQHFLHTDIFDQRATFNISYPLAFLLIKHVRSNDGGDYRCRVDFRRARTVNRILKLTVIGKFFSDYLKSHQHTHTGAHPILVHDEKLITIFHFAKR